MVLFEKHGVDEKEFFCITPLRNYHFPLHFHRAYELIFVNEGQLSVSIDKKEYILRKNDLVFIFNNQMHEFKTIDYSEITVILFSPDMIGDFFMKYNGFIPDDNALHFEGGFDLVKLNSIYSQKSFLYAVCADLINKTSFAPIKQSSETRVLYKILIYVEKHYNDDCTLKDVAKHLQYDYTYLSKLFAQVMNMTFTDYLNHYRISQACYLLKNMDQSIGEVAMNCGYDNLRTFHRNFRKITGHSPKEYRSLD